MTPPRRFARLACLAVAWLCAVIPTVWAAGADPPKTHFRLPEGDAAVTLRQFSQQARTPIVYPIDTVRGVKTNPVQGEFTAREALDRMVAGTELTVSQDAGTGALTVGRAARPPAPRNTKQTNSPSETTSTPMNRLPVLAGLLGFLAGPAADAQTAPVPARDDTITLSPFTVSTDKDVGFVAASSLAGGRLAGELKDTPVAYSVLTREFIDALGLDDLTRAVEWSVGMHQNVENGAAAVFAGNPTFSVRGVSGLSLQRNFFPYSVNFDSYNLDRFDFARGPNSVLFGAGSLGAAANTVTKQAVFGKPIRQIDVRTGSWSNNRVTTDFGASSGNLAVRVNTLWHDAKNWRDDDYQKKKSAFLTGTWRVTRNTSIRLEGEYGESDMRSAFTNISDRITGWDGTTTFAAVQTAAIPAATRNAAGVGQYGADSWVFGQAFGTTDMINFQNTPITAAANAAGTFIGGVPIVGGGVNTAGQSILYQLNLPARRFDRAIAGSAFRLPSREFTPRFSNRPTLTQRFQDITLYFNHQIGRSFFLELASDYNETDRFGDTSYNRGLNEAFIDINRVLPTGAPNPNFLKPYFEATNRYENLRGGEVFNTRLAAAYVADTRLGKFTVNFLGGAHRGKSYLRASQLSLPFGADSRLWVGRHFVRFRQYWDQADRSMPDFPGEVRAVDPVTNVTRTVRPLMVVDTTRPDNVGDNKNAYDYGNLAVQSKLFEGRLNLVTAYRVDQYKNTGVRTRFAGDYPAGWNGQDVYVRPDAPADFYALPPVVARNASGTPVGGTVPADVRPRDTNGFALPQYANDRFRDDFNPPAIEGRVGTVSVGAVYNLTRWLGLAANFAETFNPPGTVQRYDGSLLPPTAAKGIDLGARFNLLGGRFSGSVNYFKSREDNSAAVPPAGSVNNFNAIYQANAMGDTAANGRNIRGFDDLPLVIRDTIRRNTSGVEVEATANLTRQWRLLTNFSSSKPVQDNAFPDSIAYYKANEANFLRILADTGVIVNPTSKVATVDNTVPAERLSPDRNTAANAWNDIQSTFLGNLVTKPRLISGSARVTGNLFTDYTLRGGRLDGVRLGIGVNYRDKQVIGFRGGDTIVSPTDATVAIDDPAVDAYTPVYSDSFVSGTATLAYTWKLANNRRVSFNLRVDNLFGDDAVRYFLNANLASGGTAMRPRDGNVSSPARVATPTLFSYPVPRNWTLSARLDF